MRVLQIRIYKKKEKLVKMRRETSVDGIVEIFFRLASDCLKQFYIIVTLQKRPKIDTLNFDKLLLQFVVVVIKQAVIKSQIILRRLANIKFQQKRSTKVLLGGHIFLLWFRGLCCTLKIYTHNPYKKSRILRRRHPIETR